MSSAPCDCACLQECTCTTLLTDRHISVLLKEKYNEAVVCPINKLQKKSACLYTYAECGAQMPSPDRGATSWLKDEHDPMLKVLPQSAADVQSIFDRSFQPKPANNPTLHLMLFLLTIRTSATAFPLCILPASARQRLSPSLHALSD